MSELPGINPSGTLYIGNNSLLSIGKDSALLIDNGKVCINKVENTPLLNDFDRNLYEYFANGSGVLTSVTANTVVVASGDIFTLVEGGTYEFFINDIKDLGVSLVTVNADEVFDNNIGNFTSTIGYTLPQSVPKNANHRFFIYAKLNSAVRLKIDKILQTPLIIKIKRVGPFYKNALKPNTEVAQILAGACNAIMQTITFNTHIYMGIFADKPFTYIEYVKNTNQYERHLLNRIMFKNVKNKKLTADSKWESLKAYLISTGSAPEITLIEGQSWTLSMEDVFNNIPLALRILNEPTQNLKNNKIVVSQYLIKLPSTTKVLITSIDIETAVLPVGYYPAIVSATVVKATTVDPTYLEDIFPVLRKSPSYIDNTIAKLEQYNVEIAAINYTQLLNLEPSARVLAAIQILQETCHENGILKRSIIKFVEAFNISVDFSSPGSTPRVIIPETTPIYFPNIPIIDVTEFSISNNGVKILGVPREIGTFPYIVSTTPISAQDLNGMYISDPPIAWQCRSSLSINGDIESTTTDDGLTTYTIVGTSQDITGSVPYWVAPGGNANVDFSECYIRVLQSQSPHLIYKITINSNIVVSQTLRINAPILVTEDGIIDELNRKIYAMDGLKFHLVNTINTFTLLDTMNPLLNTLTKILKTIICTCAPSQDVTDRITNNDISIYTDPPALYYIITTLKDFIWARLVSDFAITPFSVYNSDLIINLKLLADDLKMTNIFTQKLPEVQEVQEVQVSVLIQNESSELLTDLPMLISILKSNTTLNFILTEWDNYYATFINNTKNSYIYNLVNALRTCYNNWKSNFQTALPDDPLVIFANIPYTGFFYFRTYLNKAKLQSSKPPIDYSSKLFQIKNVLLPAIINIFELNNAGLSAKVVIDNIYNKTNQASNDIERRLSDHLIDFTPTFLYRSELYISNIKPLLTSEDLNILNTIDFIYSNTYVDERLDILFSGRKVKKPYDIILNTHLQVYNSFMFILKVEQLLYKTGRPVDTTIPLTNDILNMRNLIEVSIKSVIVKLQKITDYRSVGGKITL